MNESKLIKHLPTIGRIFTPAAMLVVLTYEITKSQTDASGAWVIAILIGAAATAVGVEAVGILAGHTFEAYWRVGDSNRARLSLGLLGVYTIAGLVILWGNWALMPIPIIAAVVYLVSGLAESLTVQQAKEAAKDEQKTAAELEEMAKDREWQRQMEAKKLEADTAVKLARVEVKAVKSVTSQPVTSRTDGGHFPSDFRLLTAEHKDKIAQLTSGELEKIAGINDRTARRWKEKVSANGYHK